MDISALTLEMTIPSTVPALYAGDLHPDVSEGSLFELFSSVGPVASVRVCRDVVTRSSLGYGYINYISALDATSAIEKLNYIVFHGKPIRIMWSQRDPSSRRSGIGNVFVKNLAESVDNLKLKEMFLKFGTILSAKVATQDGKSKGFGFVQFDSQYSANVAIEKLNGAIVDGKKIYVGVFIRKSHRVLSNFEQKYTNLYLKNLEHDLTETLIELKFSEFGKVCSVMIPKDEEGKSKGFGFVNFEDHESAQKAMETMNGLQLGTKTLYVARAQKKAERSEILRRTYEEKRNEGIKTNMASNVYVKNIADDVDDNVFLEHFSQCGTITSAKVMRGVKGFSKGFGFVCFSNHEEANKAVNTLHGNMFHGKPLYVAIAERKEDRRARLNACFSQRSCPAAAVIPANYPSLYYGASGIMPHIPSYHQPFWQQTGFVSPSVPGIPRFPFFPSTARYQRPPNRAQSVPYVPQMRQTNNSSNPLKDRNGHRTKYAQSNGRQGSTHDNSNTNNANEVGEEDDNNRASSSSTNPRHGMGILSSMLAAATPEHQKQMLGEHIFPLVQNLKAEMAAKITGMLLEMDNSELLLLLESPESLAAKVDEAVQVLNLSSSKKTEPDAGSNTAQEEPLPHPASNNSFLSSVVAVN